MEVGSKIKHMDEFDCKGKTVLLRVDINSPIDSKRKKIVNENRIQKSIPTIEGLLQKGARLAIIAHQGDTLDYPNLISMEEHAAKLGKYLGRKVKYVDDVAGPAAQLAVKNLREGEAVLLGNLRYLTEEVSTFENAVKLCPEEMTETYLVRNLAPLMDIYINDAFAAAHRNAPSMVAFQELLPSGGGLLLMEEVSSLSKVLTDPAKPCVFVLGGAKISDAFGMMGTVLASGAADKILTCGVTGEIMLMAQGISLGSVKEGFIKDRGLDVFCKDAEKYLWDYPDKILFPWDLAYEKSSKREEIFVNRLPQEEMFMDIGEETIRRYGEEIKKAATIFVNGPAGAYENPIFEKGTREILGYIAEAKGYSVIGGGDTVAAAQKLVGTQGIDYVSTAGGAMVQYMSGKELPLLKAMMKK